MFRKPFHFMLAAFAIVILLISPTVAIAHSLVDQYFETQTAVGPGGY